MLVSVYRGGERAPDPSVSRCSRTGSTLKQLLGGAALGLLAETGVQKAWARPAKPYWWELSGDSVKPLPAL